MPHGGAGWPVEPRDGAMGPPSCCFYTHGLCPYAQRVALALRWKGVPHETVEIDLSNKPPWYAQKLGTTLVPAITLDDVPHSDSLSIIQTLEGAYPHAPLTPTDGARASACSQLVRFSGTLESAGWSLLGGSWSFPRSGRASKAGRAGWERAVATLEAALDAHRGPYLVGAEPTVADAALAPFVARFELAAERCLGYDVRGASPRLSEYLTALDADAAWAATWPDRDAFGEAIREYGSLDYFDFHTASLANPRPAR